jgi:hypothetical protein
MWLLGASFLELSFVQISWLNRDSFTRSRSQSLELRKPFRTFAARSMTRPVTRSDLETTHERGLTSGVEGLTSTPMHANDLASAIGLGIWPSALSAPFMVHGRTAACVICDARVICLGSEVSA